MRVYYLHLTQDDFVQTGNSWETSFIDLYDNAYYKNYSLTKSQYGLNLLGDSTWTGQRQTGPTSTDSGHFVGARARRDDRQS